MNKLDEVINKLPKAKTYSTAISNSLNSALEFELGFDHALQQYSDKGDVIKTSERYLEGMKNRFSELIFLEHLIMSTGFSYFREEIINLHLQKLFGKKKE